jgi:GrpB-like predicted nucleotidyltransferase (UPF0157 family)/ubiquinone/menaquinone biosynthesis C-methylase UbiE
MTPTIDVVPYDPAWPEAFEAERRRIAEALGGVAIRIEHNGSTAVPGLAAKPVIDIQIAVARLRPSEPYVSALASLGYTHVPHEDDARCPFFHRPATWPHSHHVHVVEAGGEEERRTLAFRDYLRTHPAAAGEYESLKRRLASQFGAGDEVAREQYADAKTAFVEQIVARAAVETHYERYAEETRLGSGPSQLEFERTKEILLRHLPAPPVRIVDVGGAAGAYSLWLAQLGHEVHLVDASARLVEEARRRSASSPRPVASAQVGHACALPQRDASADVVLVMGPLYHLPSADDRAKALEEAFRILATPGFVAVAAISRYASALDGLARNLSLDPDFLAIRDRDLADGQHRNVTANPDYFTTAYFHVPDDLRSEISAAGFEQVRVLGVEGPAWLLSDFDARWADAARRDVILDTARALEAQPSVVGASAHLLGLGWKR